MREGRPPLRPSPRSPGERLRSRPRGAFVEFWTERIRVLFEGLRSEGVLSDVDDG